VTSSPGIPIESIRRAAADLEGVAVRTPLVTVPAAALPGPPVALKCEHLQPIGAFKVRGAFTAISRLPARERARGVITHSSGNHGQAVAFVARHFGVPAIIVMPADAPAVKVDGVRRYGGQVEFVTDRAQRQPRCEALAAEHGMVMVPPYENPDVIAGQGTVGLEILEQCPDVRTIVVQVGGGGLIAGIASAVRAIRPDVEVVGVEPEGAPKLARALEAGRPVRLASAQSIADGLLPFQIGTLPFDVMQGTVRRAVQVSDGEIGAAVRFLHEQVSLDVEPSGAAAFAAILAGRLERTESMVAVVSGGNVDPELFQRLVH
jgi:threonine dehydratase